MNPLHGQMEQAWQSTWDSLFCPETNLFYDYITSRDPAKRFAHLPTADEIARQFPNPGGWGTGMEDSMLNAGSAMDILSLRRELTGDAAALPQAQRVLDGMFRCCTVHGVSGFVVRSLLPADGRSCYFNSSRDQFTLCVYGGWRFLRSFPDADRESTNKARSMLVDIARYCEQTLVEGNGDLRRLDGGPALVSSVLNTAAHEALRLPMFYAAAWVASGDRHWHDLCLRYARQGLQQTLAMDPSHPWWDIELSQMQLSLELLRDAEPTLRSGYDRAMQLTAQLAEKYLRSELARAASFDGGWATLNTDWRRMPMVIREETLRPPHTSAIFGGFPYLMPQFDAKYMRPYSMLRAIGNYLYTVLLCRDFPISPELPTQIAALAAEPDLLRHGSDATIKLLHGYWIARRRQLWH